MSLYVCTYKNIYKKKKGVKIFINKPEDLD